MTDTIDRAAGIVQTAYPQIYLACHTRHQRKRTTSHRLSQRDSAILSHLDVNEPISAAELAAHLAIGRPTLSEALKRLVACGYVRTDRAERRTGVVLTELGMDAIRDTSVLETPRLRRALESLSARELKQVSEGLTLLAAACRALRAPTVRAPVRKTRGATT
jgi:DNA-binding MarR family transcriptional regulator